MAVHVGHLELVLEVGHGAKAPEDHMGIASRCVVDQKAVEAVDLDAAWVSAHVHDGFVDHLHSLGDREKRPLRLVVQDRYDDLLERHQATLDDGGVTLGDRVERSRINGDAH
ncbi:MAG: hypothetical protein AMS21_00455 [Gemmatimonas sp. SG8_38_2]|nr:MAG: hypothetical protein AMS21_00455 [Gemmatimonas sp. SG8_38_2]